MVLLCRLSIEQTWSALGRGLNPYEFGVSAMTEYDGKIIVSGLLDSAGTVPLYDFMAAWNGTSWDSVFSYLMGWQSSGPEAVNDVWSFLNYQNNLYIGGSINNIDKTPATNVIEWNGESWNEMGSTGLGGGLAGFVYALTVYNDNLVAGGIFYSSETNRNIALWNGTSWDTLSTGIVGSGIYNEVYALAEYNGNLYAGGTFTTAGGKPANNIAMWNGTSWSAVGSGINGAVGALIAYKGELYAGGNFDSAGGQPANYIAKWNGTFWSAVGKGLRGGVNGRGVGCFTLFNDNLVAGGNFDSAGRLYANNLAVWDGITWSALTSKKMSRYSYINALVSYNGNLYVGGGFDSIGGIQANDIAEYSLHSSDTLPAAYFEVYPNPATGVFTFESSVSGQLTVEIYNVLGQKIHYATLKQVQGDNTIDLSSYANGVYFYLVTTETGAKIATGKLVKQ